MTHPRRRAARPGRSVSSWASYLLLALTAALFVAMVTYAYSGLGRYLTRQAPLADAAMEIRLEATTGYLWLEEFIGGLRTVSLEEILQHLDRADWYAGAMLHGGANAEGTFTALEDPSLRQNIEKVRSLLAEFRQLALRRHGGRGEPLSDRADHQRQHALFLAFNTAADEVETEIQRAMEREATVFRATEGILIAASIVAALFAGLALRRADRNRQEHVTVVERERRAAQENEARFRSLFEHSNDAVFLHDTAGRILEVNERASEMLGYSPEQLRGMHASELCSEDVRGDSVAAFERVAARGEARTKSRYRRADGTALDVEVSARLVDPGEPVVQSIVRDITEHERLVERLRQTLDFLETLLDTIPNPVFHKDARGVYRGCNRSFAEQILGLPREAIVGRTLFELPDTIPADLAERYHRADLELFTHPGRQTYEAPVRCADGSRREFLFSKATYADDDGRVDGLVGVMIDVTERKETERALRRARDELELRIQERTGELSAANRRLLAEVEERQRAEEALRASERKYSTVVESSPIGVFIYQDGAYAFVNQRFADIVEYPKEELIGLTPDRLTHPDDWPWIQRIAQDRLQGVSVAKQFEVRVLTRGGQTRWLAMNNALIEYRGRPATLGNGIDVTARKEMEQALAASEDERRVLLARLVTAQEQERGRIARELHDGIGQSLSALKFLVENLAADGWSDPPAASEPTSPRSLVPRIQAAMEEVRRISLALRPSILDDLGLGATVNWLCREFSAAHPGVDVRKVTSLEEDRIPDELKTAIFRVLQEALNNVAKHSQAATVRVAVGCDEETVELAVDDDGVGFDPATASRSAGRPDRGFGLGNMRERTELSGGRFTLESAPGRGTHVRASWPLDPA